MLKAFAAAKRVLIAMKRQKTRTAAEKKAPELMLRGFGCTGTILVETRPDREQQEILGIKIARGRKKSKGQAEAAASASDKER